MKSLRDRILKLVNGPRYKPASATSLARKLKIADKGMSAFQKTLDQLICESVLRENKNGRIIRRGEGSVSGLTGIVKRNSRGDGFVVIKNPSAELNARDIFVDARDLGDAQDGDEVLVRLSQRRRSGGQRCGSVVKVVNRVSSTFVGTYFEEPGKGLVRVDGTVFQNPVPVGDPGAKGARPDDKVVIEIVKFPTAAKPGQAVLTKVIGKKGDPGVDTMSVVLGLGIPHEFPEDVLEEARQLALEFDDTDFQGRRDLTKETIITIDPDDARDFDDAISLRRSRDGHWHLGVHIADVAHFVQPGSALDREAKERGTSVYLPRHVIPMLPEVISNGLASLQQDQIRYTKSVLIEFDKDGLPLHTEFANTVIKVTRRFAYEQVMPILKDPGSFKDDVGAKVLSLLERMLKLAMILRKRRFRNGALEMGIPEVEIDFDADGNVIGAHESEHDESHEIIEEFMLAANIAVATELARLEIPSLRRIHSVPDELKLRAFRDFVESLGFTVDKYQSRHDLRALITSVRGTPPERAVNFALLRSMKQAEYSPELFSHYALAEENYSHFTSPIRRYPDLTLHRIVGQLADGKKVRPDAFDTLLQLGRTCSHTERRAEKAERELIRIRLLRYMSTRVGEELDAIITGVESFGLFCQGVQIPAEGMIHISQLGEADYRYDQDSRSLVSTRSEHRYQLGDPLRVVVDKVDIDRRQLSYRPAGKPVGAKTDASRSANPPGSGVGKGSRFRSDSTAKDSRRKSTKRAPRGKKRR